MRHVIAGTVGLALCAAVAGMSPARAAEEVPAPDLAPCTIELVDGRSVEGRLAVRFEMDDHLVVYSPRVATVRSLLKKHVHAVTVDGKREELNPKRAFTEEDVVVKAGAFKDGKQFGDTAQTRFRFVTPDEVEWSEGGNPDRTSEGLAYRYFEGEWKTMPEFGSLKCVKTGVAPGLDIESAKQRGDKFAIVFEGYIAVHAKGPYNVHLSTGKADACRVFLDGRLIIDNDVQTLESVGLVGLAAGKHALRVEFVDGGWGEYVLMALRGLAESQKQTVTADMLSH
jgi:hypothetical protein